MRTLTYIAILAAVLAVSPANAAVYDLATDWSTTVNPFGPWSLWKSPTALFTTYQTNWYTAPTGAWSDELVPGNAHVPAWATYLGTHFIYAHGAEFDRTGTNYTSAMWTSPEAGTATISGAAWNSWVSNRTMTWQIRKNGAILTQGTCYGNGVYSAASPFNFAAGSGGAAALTQSINIGDRIELALISISSSGNIGDALYLTFSINTNSTPVVASKCPSARDVVATAAQDSYLFAFCGKVTIEDASAFRIDDGSGKAVRVLAPGYSGISDGDIVSVRGILDPATTPPTITCSPNEVKEYQQPPDPAGV